MFPTQASTLPPRTCCLQTGSVCLCAPETVWVDGHWLGILTHKEVFHGLMEMSLMLGGFNHSLIIFTQNLANDFLSRRSKRWREGG